ncbi:hypothetical protein PAMA_008204 [Pampus argenteus]
MKPVKAVGIKETYRRISDTEPRKAPRAKSSRRKRCFLLMKLRDRCGFREENKAAFIPCSVRQRHREPRRSSRAVGVTLRLFAHLHTHAEAQEGLRRAPSTDSATAARPAINNDVFIPPRYLIHAPSFSQLRQ